MTPNNIAGMAALKGLQIVALTDHNSCKNCPAFFEACKRQGIIAIAGMELSTAEDIHLVCLFEELEQAMEILRKITKRSVTT
jgi:predicted metal-dependent phosphoesterase TrpH